MCVDWASTKYAIIFTGLWRCMRAATDWIFECESPLFRPNTEIRMNNLFGIYFTSYMTDRKMKIPRKTRNAVNSFHTIAEHNSGRIKDFPLSISLSHRLVQNIFLLGPIMQIRTYVRVPIFEFRHSETVGAHRCIYYLRGEITLGGKIRKCMSEITHSL